MSVIDDIAAERRRQVEVENWSEGHDNRHQRGEMADAAACYAAGGMTFRAVRVTAARGRYKHDRLVDLWPWASKWWKPKNKRRDLIRAGALIVAEIERLDRAAASANGTDAE
jgi:hypothetical protein